MTSFDHSGDCLEALGRLHHFIDGELDDGRRAVIQTHLDKCPPCFDAFGFEKQLRAVVASKCQDRVPDDLRARIAVALQQELKLRGTPPGKPWPAGGGMPAL